MRHSSFSQPGMASILIVVVAVLLSSGCGGSGNQTNTSTTTTNSASTAPVTFTIGDAPLSGILAFEVTVNNVTLTGTAGTVTLLSTPRQIEASHLAGTFIPVALMNVPKGTYTQMTVTLGSAEVLFLGQGSSVPLHKNIPAPAAPINIALSPAVVIAGGPSSLNLDFNLANSVNIDAGNNVTFNPSLTATDSPIGDEGQQEAENGEADDLKGTFASFSGTQFTIKVGGGTQTLTVNTNTSTLFDPRGLTVNTIPIGTVVNVDASTQPDGSLLAKKVEVESESQLGMETEGLVSAVAGNAVTTSFQLVTHEVSAPSANVPALGSMITVMLGTNPTFRINGVGNPTIPSGLTFSAASLAPGQAVEADTDVAAATNVTVNRVQLKEEAVDGTIGMMSGSTFQLTLDPNSTLAKLTGTTSISVSSAGAQTKTGVTLAAGQAVRVRGLLFFTPAAGMTASSYTLVARQFGKQ